MASRLFQTGKHRFISTFIKHSSRSTRRRQMFCTTYVVRPIQVKTVRHNDVQKTGKTKCTIPGVVVETGRYEKRATAGIYSEYVVTDGSCCALRI